MKIILEYIKSKPKFFTSDSEVANVKSCFRNSMSWVRKVANFPPKEARDIYFRYFPNALDDSAEKINCLDTSCGFGSRMSSVLLSGHNYFGIDPNIELQGKLMECAKFYYDNGFIDENQSCSLYTQGSELFIDELEGMIDVSFTSPPYFNLEKYSDDESESTKHYDNYELWLEKFVKPTIDNTYKYLKIGGYAMINIKNLTRKGKEPLFDDWLKLFDEHSGFEFVEIFEMKHQGAKNFWMNTNYNKEDYKGFQEPIMSFRKVS